MDDTEIPRNKWTICTPTLFRYMDSKYVEAFFTDGSLRLSSMSLFSKHTDEQRLDAGEGKVMFVHRTNQGGGQTLATWAIQGTNAYVLSTSMMYDRDLCESFHSDSYIRINDSIGFGTAIALHIPALLLGLEGPCLYQGKKIIEKDLGYIDISQFQDPDNTERVDDTLLKQLDQISLRPDTALPAGNARLTQLILRRMQHYALFLKDKRFSRQVEYRFVWVLANGADDYLEVKVPEAIQFCEKPNPLIE